MCNKLGGSFRTLLQTPNDRTKATISKIRRATKNLGNCRTLYIPKTSDESKFFWKCDVQQNSNTRCCASVLILSPKIGRKLILCNCDVQQNLKTCCHASLLTFFLKIRRKLIFKDCDVQQKCYNLT
jgi:hypothetical protein